jgi:hypothetical protein
MSGIDERHMASAGWLIAASWADVESGAIYSLLETYHANKHGASKIINTFEMYQEATFRSWRR